MATYTNANGIKKISTGDEAGTWGESTNTNFDIIDRASSGYNSSLNIDGLSGSGTSGDPYVLPMSLIAELKNGHYKAIRFTSSGTLSSDTYLLLEQNSQSRIYMFLNNTTGGQNIIVSQGSGANVTIATGKSSIILADGAGAGAAVTDFTSTISNLSSPVMTGTPTAPTAAIGTDSTQIATTAFVKDIIPSGVILLWSGSTGSIPAGWVLCDGTNSTPDLRNRFVVGAGDTYAVGATGGADSVTLTTSQIPSHNHTATSTSSVSDPGHSHTFTGTAPSGGTGDSSRIAEPTTRTTNSATTGISVSTSTSIGNTGGGSSHENRPPYYALAYIMKT
jgi:microcystin-dependent protein